jgi:hypothetical protein
MGQPTAFAPAGPARPTEALTASRGGVGSSAQTTTAHAQRTTSNGQECLYPQERCTAEPATTIGLVRCSVPTETVSHQGAEIAPERGLLAEATHTSPLGLKPHGLRRATAHSSQL